MASEKKLLAESSTSVEEAMLRVPNPVGPVGFFCYFFFFGGGEEVEGEEGEK